jgi:predicted metal-dependent phosphoesterase TrpH
MAGLMAAPRYAIAHVTPYPWEAQDNEVNTHVRAVTEELSRRGHRVLVLAPSRSQERVRASRRALRGARTRVGGTESLLEGSDGGTPTVIAVGEVLDFQTWGPSSSRRTPALPIDVARTIEELLSTVTLDIVHVHEPFAPSTSNAALRHSRALNVGSFHSASERLLSTLVARRFVESFFGRLDARTASLPATAELMGRQFPGDYRLVPDGTGDETDGVGDGVDKTDVKGIGDTENATRDAGVRGGRDTYARTVDELESIYHELAARRHNPEGDPALRRKLAGRALIDVDLHMHTDHSGDCETPVEVLLATARERGLGAIAVTDHNEISGALAAREMAREMDVGVKVIVGEEVKTADQGEVIGLFIEELIPRGMSLQETVAEIRRQGGLVYVPHPFDRLHSVPDYEHLLKIVADVDAIEVFNPRVAIGAFNDEAARFADKYRIVAGAGSDSHVAQGLGSVRIRMREFDGPAEFLQSLRDADIITRPTSLLYVQALKFLQTRATPPSARRASRARRVKRAMGGSRK